MCPCGSCTQTSDLKPEFVAHVGEVATPLAESPHPSWPGRIGGTVGMVGRGLPHMVRLGRPTAAAH